jgi:ABC-type lipoprotein release transport system permease subunit
VAQDDNAIFLAMLTAMEVFAGYIPTRPTARIDPAIALRP